MRIAISMTGKDMASESSSLFGRCPYYIVVETDSMAFEAFANPAVGASGGAGVQASQFVLEQNAEAVLTGRVGPNAMKVFEQAGTALYQTQGRSVKEEVQSFMAGELESITAPGASHVGMGGGSHQAKAPAKPDRSEKIRALTKKAKQLRLELAALMDEIDRLEAEGS